MATQAEVLKAFLTGEGLPKKWKSRPPLPQGLGGSRHVLEAKLGRYGVIELWRDQQVVAACAEKKYVVHDGGMGVTAVRKLAEAITAANQAGAAFNSLRFSRTGVQPDRSATQVMAAGGWGGDGSWEDL